MDDSNASQALLHNGSGTFGTTGNAVTGGYLNNGSGSITPTPVTSVPPAPDPLGYLSEPTVGACTYPSQVIYNGSGNYTASHGTYCGGLLVNGSLNLTLNSGLYIIDGGTLTFNGSGTITGSNVTFYLTNGASATLNGSQTFQFTAPTSGTYAGILFFQDRSDTSNATINGSASSNFTGALYFAAAQLTYNGSGPLSAYTILVANTIIINGSSTINDNYTSLPGGVSPITKAVLVE
jgi:hypothetical protein